MGKNNATYKDWELFKNNFLKETYILKEDEGTRLKRIARLEQHPEEWFKHYFPAYCYAEPVPFQKAATKRILNNPTWYEVRAWSRELAKSARTMLETIYMAATGKIKNVLMISATEDSAINLLKPYKLTFEYNQRLISDYGDQIGMSNWEEHHFITRVGCSFLAVGAGQSPRGTRFEEVRPDMMIFDDIDTDEEVRNPDRIAKKWAWIEKAVIFTASVSKSKRIMFLGNIIGKDTCITRASKKADYAEIINIRDNNGISVWPQKNTEANIDWMLSKVSYAAGQQEFFNNPISEGATFKDIVWAKTPTLDKFKFLVAYGEPSPSDRQHKKSSYKSIPLIGEYQGSYYILTCFLQQTTNAKFIEWYFDINKFVNGKAVIYNYVENNSLQDPFYMQVLIPLLGIESDKQQKILHIIPDTRTKPDKFVRMESLLEPLVRMGKLIFNMAEQNNPHMQQLEEQFKAVEPSLSAHADGVDAVEGAIWLIQNKLRQAKPIDFKTIKSKKSKNRY